MTDDRPEGHLDEPEGDLAGPDGHLSVPDAKALADLQQTKAQIASLLDDDTLPPHVHGRLLTEYRQYVAAILELELKRPGPKKRTVVDELRERRAARRQAIREQYGTQQEDTP